LGIVLDGGEIERIDGWIGALAFLELFLLLFFIGFRWIYCLDWLERIEDSLMKNLAGSRRVIGFGVFMLCRHYNSHRRTIFLPLLSAQLQLFIELDAAAH
jgi:hypothetical protein